MGNNINYKIAIKYVISCCLLLAFGCGKKNVVNTGTTSGTPVGGTTSGTSYLSSQDLTKLQTQYPCTQGNRVSDLHFSTTSTANYSGNSTVVSGPFNPGLISGSIDTTYFGVSGFNDLIIVHKIVNSSQVTGFNIVLSMCEFQSIIAQGRGLSGFTANNGIILDQDTNCSYSSVDAATNTVLIAAATSLLPEYPVVTTFTKASCGGGYY